MPKNLLPVNQEPRATNHIDDIIRLIEQLQAKGIAYKTKSGDICFEVEKFQGYGKLSKKDIEGQQSGARVNVVEDKKHPFDMYSGDTFFSPRPTFRIVVWSHLASIYGN